jgi:soluble lytic murein transglycosylase
MKLLKVSLILLAIGALWSTSVAIKNRRMNQLVESGKIPYGPMPDISRDYYSFDSLHSAFDSRLDLKRSDEFTKSEFESLILKSIDSNARENLQKYLAPTLTMSEDYQMDPFWILSVMMVESGFDKKAQSNKNARGLMQIRPDTAEHLYTLMGRKIVNEEQLHSQTHHPAENIEMGVFYLKKLLQNFRLNYHLATIAYNVGPNKLKDLLITDEIDTVNFSYLVKVQERYKDLTKSFVTELRKRPRPYETTYVLRGQGKNLEEHLLKLYTAALPELNADFLLTSENLSVKNSIL